MRSGHRVNRFIVWNDTSACEEAQNLTEKSRQAFENRIGIAWAGVCKERDAFIGASSFNRIDFQNLRAEIGGEMSIDYWGRKLAIEAVATIVDFGFGRFGLHAIEARLDSDNRSDIALLETLGFVKEAHFRDYIYFREAFRDLVVYTCHRSDPGRCSLDCAQRACLVPGLGFCCAHAARMTGLVSFSRPGGSRPIAGRYPPCRFHGRVSLPRFCLWHALPPSPPGLCAGSALQCHPLFVGPLAA
jgi:ribosomal-protein-alanine N-acetyltransferase